MNKHRIRQAAKKALVRTLKYRVKANADAVQYAEDMRSPINILKGAVQDLKNMYVSEDDSDLTDALDEIAGTINSVVKKLETIQSGINKISDSN